MSYIPPITVNFNLLGDYVSPVANGIIFDFATSDEVLPVYSTANARQVQSSRASIGVFVDATVQSFQIQSSSGYSAVSLPIYSSATSNQLQTSFCETYTVGSDFYMRSHLGNIKSMNSNLLGNLITI